MIVELFGPPGSGKSFLVPRLAAEHKLPIIRLGFGQKYALAFLFAILNPRLTLLLYRLWDNRTRVLREQRRKKLYRLVSFLAKEQKARLLRGGVIDEGIFQFFLILHEDKISPAEIGRCLALLPREPYVIAIVDTDRATRIERMIARGKVSRGFLGEAYQARWQDTLDANAAALKALYESRFVCTTLRN